MTRDTLERIRSLAGEWVRQLNMDLDLADGAAPDAMRAFHDHATRLTRAGVRVTAIVLLLLTLLAWPTDLLVFPTGSDGIDLLADWRLSTLGLCVVVLAGLRASHYIAQRPFPLALVAFTLSMGGTGYLMARLGGLESPLTYGVYTVPLMTVLLIVDLPRRAVAAVLMVVAYFVCFFATEPATLARPEAVTPIVWAVASAIAAVAVGHVVYLLLRANYLQHRALDDMRRRLEGRVAEQTEQLRDLARNLASVQEEERVRIAREIHDELGQTLTGLRMELENLEGASGHDAIDRPRLAEGFARAGALLTSLHDAVGAVLNALRPRLLDSYGLIAAVEALARDLERKADLACAVSCGLDEEALSQEQCIALYRVVQEALTNVARHAHARNVWISLDVDDRDASIEIRDDGVGFDPEAAAARGRFGMVGIRERARLVGGSCTVDSGPARGTCIRIRFPYPADVPAA
jgi:signal transduction histidine kinase